LTKLCLIKARITDAGIKHLLPLSRLTSLFLNDTQISDAGLAELRKKLPNATIVR